MANHNRTDVESPDDALATVRRRMRNLEVEWQAHRSGECLSSDCSYCADYGPDYEALNERPEDDGVRYVDGQLRVDY